jgi:hypothetical protein
MRELARVGRAWLGAGPLGAWRICLLWYQDYPEQSQREDWFIYDFIYDRDRVRLVQDGLVGKKKPGAIDQLRASRATSPRWCR